MSKKKKTQNQEIRQKKVIQECWLGPKQTQKSQEEAVRRLIIFFLLNNTKLNCEKANVFTVVIITGLGIGQWNIKDLQILNLYWLSSLQTFHKFQKLNWNTAINMCNGPATNFAWLQSDYSCGSAAQMKYRAVTFLEKCDFFWQSKRKLFQRISYL